jgi:hypothetical protein
MTFLFKFLTLGANRPVAYTLSLCSFLEESEIYSPLLSSLFSFAKTLTHLFSFQLFGLTKGKVKRGFWENSSFGELS